MKVEEIKNPKGLVLRVLTNSQRNLTGVVVQRNFVILNELGVTGEILPVDCILIGSATILDVWSSLKEFYSK